MSTTIVSPPIGVDVLFWGIDLSKEDVQRDEGDKVKEFQLHPGDRPWILCVDRNDVVIIWDYSKKSCVMRCSLVEICASAEIGSASQPKESNVVESFGHSFLSDKMSSLPFCGNFPPYLASLNSGPYSQRECGDYFRKSVNHWSQERTGAHISSPSHGQPKGPPTAVSTVRSNPGDIRALHFMDADSMSFYSGDRLLHEGSSGFCSSTVVMIVTEVAIIFYDFMAQRSKVIPLLEAKPLCAEMIFFDLLAIGCSDGTIRVWDLCQWKQVKSLTNPSPHSKEIVSLKSIPILRKVVDDVGTHHGYERIASTVSSVGGTIMREGSVRLVSVDASGLGLLWEGAAMGNIVQVDAPAARLQDTLGAGLSTGCLSVDEATNSLTVFCGDKSIRTYSMDMLDSLRQSKRASISRQRSSQQLSAPVRRSSIAMGFRGGAAAAAADDALSDIPLLSCDSRARPGHQFASASTRPASFARACHPRLRSDSYFCVTKGNEVTVLQALGSAALAGTDDVSDSASTMDKDSDSTKLTQSQIININTVLAMYLRGLRSPVALSITAHACDPTLKIYSVQTHSLRPTLVALATSLGVLMLEYAPVHAQDPFCGAHPGWNNCFVRYHSGNAKLYLVRLDISTAAAAAGAGGDATSSNAVANVSLLDVANCHVTGGDGSGVPGSQSHDSLHSGPGSNSTSASSSSSSAVLASALRPRVVVSPSGKFVALLWAELVQYRVFDVRAGAEFIGREHIAEVDAGQAIDFAWVGVDDHFAVLGPLRRVEAAQAKRRRSIFGGPQEDPAGGGAGGGAAALLPPAVQLRKIQRMAVGSKCEVEPVEFEFPADSGLAEPQGLFGGPLLAVVCPLKAYSTKRGSGQKSISKIEAEALEAQIEASSAADNASEAGQNVSLSSARLNGIRVARAAVNRLIEDRVGGSSNMLLATQCCQFHRLGTHKTTGKTYFEPIGPTVHAPTTIAWAEDRRFCALVMDNMVTVIGFGVGEGSDVSVVGTTQLDCAMSPINSLTWRAGLLFVATTTSLSAVCALYDGSGLEVTKIASSSQVRPCPSRVLLDEEYPGDATAIINTRKSLLYHIMPLGWFETICVRKGQILMLSRDGEKVCSIPLLANLEMAVVAQLNAAVQFGEAKLSPASNSRTVGPRIAAALGWTAHLPMHMHDYLAEKFVSRGYAIEATLIPGVSLPYLVGACHQAGVKDEEQYYAAMLRSVVSQLPKPLLSALTPPALVGSVALSVGSAAQVAPVNSNLMQAPQT